MINEQRTESKEKTCIDCLNCKVSKYSTNKKRLCFCSEIGKKAMLEEVYWKKRTVCNNFNDMSA